jgi:hypothetical protein
MKNSIKIIILFLLIPIVLSCNQNITYQSKVVKKYLGDNYSSLKYFENSKYEINSKLYDTYYHFTYNIKELDNLELYYVKTNYIVENGYDDYTLINNRYSDSLARILDGDYKITKNEITSKDGKTLYRYIGKRKEYAVDEDIEKINDFAFLNTNLDTLILNEKLKKISNYAFSCFKVENLIVNSDVYFIGFEFPYDTIKTLKINSEVNRKLWMECNNLETLIYGNLENLNTNTLFFGLKVDKLVLPQNLIKINRNSFDNTEIKKLLIIPDSVKYIDILAFSQSENLKMYIPSTVEINESAFSNVKNITIYTDAKTFPEIWKFPIGKEEYINIIYNTKLKDVK